MKYTVDLGEGRAYVIEAESFDGHTNGLIVFRDGCSAPVAAVQAHSIHSIKTDAVSEEPK